MEKPYGPAMACGACPGLWDGAACGRPVAETWAQPSLAHHGRPAYKGGRGQ
jgi:hypothetical protein